MKKMMFGLLCVFSAHVFAVTAADIQAANAEMNRACSQPNSNRTGSSEQKACWAAVQRTQANSDQLMRQIYGGMEQREQDRQRIQQEEIWREQIRRGNR